MWSKFNYPHVGLFVLAWFLADLIVPAMCLLASRAGAMDQPHGYKTHTQPTPRLGGVGIYLAFAVALFSTLRFEAFEGDFSVAALFLSDANKGVFSIVLGGFIVMCVGLSDDFRPLSAVVKLAILFAVTVMLGAAGIQLTLFPALPLGDAPSQQWEWAWALLVNAPNVLLTLFWIAGVISAMNSLDNMDGAAGGVTAIICFFMFMIAWHTGQRWLSFVSVCLLGSCLGFLRYNFHWQGAKIFLGDNGAFFLGLSVAAMAALAEYSGIHSSVVSVDTDIDPLRSFIVPCALLGVPLYDLTLSTILRVIHGKVRTVREAIVFCGRDHVAHRLVALGLTRRQAVLMMYLMGALSGCAAYLIVVKQLTQSEYLLLAGAGLASMTALGFILNKADVYSDRSTYTTTDFNPFGK